ncbi:adrenodoxin-like [Argonauta hians]
MFRFIPVVFRSTCRLLTSTRPLTSKRDTQCMSVRNFLTSQTKTKDKVILHFVNVDGSKITTEAKVDNTILDTVIDNDLGFDGFGACEGTMACSTCHVVLPKNIFEMGVISDEEQDLLDMAYGLTDTSRLGCQVYVTKEMDGIEIKIPSETTDIRGIS